ncbi:acetamidase/formamidase family protein [Quadrisphaera setariae]|uniref:Acetamidase n=1 Tax=Quadrisphaera setariae TaxID=2593304 RepID=A0A5C8ZHU5_9ACTN|nr:acetamidase/formamidase family protein [Quadrisphaera setariae]TXR56741.1 acetamidase [Quadrisphaera setariae]
MRHRLAPDREALHGRFDPSLPPALVVDDGDVVVGSCLDSGWHASEQAPQALATGELLPWPQHDPVLDPGHALTGPVAVRGARPGDVLEVRVLDVRPGAWALTGAGSRETFADRAAGVDELPREVLVWQLDDARTRAVDQFGDAVAVRAFPGLVGTCPAVPPGAGPRSTVPPRRTGGNLDCRELVAGSALFLPVEVPGALLSFGDGHAAQGDGEVAGVALECPLEVLELQLLLHRGDGDDDVDERGRAPWALPGGRPWATTPAGAVVFGTGTSLDEAAADALGGVVDLLCARHALSRQRALALASAAVDLRVTQVVNGGVHGVHAVLPPGRLEIAG